MSGSPTPTGRPTREAIPAATRAASPPSAEHASSARRTLLQAALLGILGDALLRDGPVGVGLLFWMIAFSAGAIALSWRSGARVTREQRAWLAVAVAFASGLTWRDAEGLQFFDFVAMIGALALLGATLSAGSPIQSVLGTRVRDLVQGVVRSAADVATGFLSLVFVDTNLGATRHHLAADRTRAWLRAALITLPLLLLFGALLAEADPVFGSLFKLPHFDAQVVISHILIAGFFTWVTAGWMRGALVDTTPRPRLSSGFPITLSSLEITITLGALAALFTLFVGVQIGWLFGGEALVRSTTGLGYAQYARRGFFELVWVSLLVLPVLLGTRAAIAAGDEPAVRRHRQLAIPVLLLLGAIMLSALGRMRLYVGYYGLTTDRLFATVFMLWLAVVFIWFGLTVLRRHERDFAAGMTITGFFTLAVLNAVNPDALVARVNVGRAGTAITRVESVTTDTAQVGGGTIVTWRSPIDYAYLTSSLSGDAADVVVRALLAPPVSAATAPARSAEVKARCNAVRSLLSEWLPAAPNDDSRAARLQRDWRRWNLGAARARAVVRANESALRAVTCWDVNGEAPFGDRERRNATPGEQWYVEPRVP